MKKVLSLLLVFVMAFALCSCETNEETSTEEQNGFAETSETVNEQQNTIDKKNIMYYNISNRLVTFVK